MHKKQTSLLTGAIFFFIYFIFYIFLDLLDRYLVTYIYLLATY